MSYQSLIEDIVGAQQNILGDAAIDIAQQVHGLRVADDGTVDAINGDGLTAVDDLASAYVDELGAAATVTMKSAAEPYAGDLELPNSLQ